MPSPDPATATGYWVHQSKKSKRALSALLGHSLAQGLLHPGAPGNGNTHCHQPAQVHLTTPAYSSYSTLSLSDQETVTIKSGKNQLQSNAACTDVVTVPADTHRTPEKTELPNRTALSRPQEPFVSL